MGTGGAGSTPRAAYQLVIASFQLYRRYPLLFFVLAAAVIVPYELILLAVGGLGPLGPGATALVTLADLGLVTPLVSALHVRAVSEVREGKEPQLLPVARQGLRALPVVGFVSIVAWLGILVGFVALIAPGIYLFLRWFVVAQVAAIEREGWRAALRRSGELTDLRFGHVFVFTIYVVLIVIAPVLLLNLGIGAGAADVVPFLVRLAVEVVTSSFGALAAALLYYDLRVRRELVPARGGVGDGPQPHSPDPRDYSPEARPRGWYVDPRYPDRMRWWGGEDPPTWIGSTATPWKIRQAWRANKEDKSEDPL